MRKLVLVSASFLMLFTIQAQVVDKKAEGILNGVSTKIQSLKTIYIEFTYLMENTKEKIKEQKKGNIYIEGSKYRLNISDQLVICDGKTVWTYFAKGNEVQINDADPEDENTPTKMLTGYSKNYRPKFISESIKAGKTIQVIDLTPNKTQSFYKIRVEIDKKTNMIDNSTIYDKNGSTYTYKVDTFTENPTVSPSRFTFKQSDYPKVIVTDMR